MQKKSILLIVLCFCLRSSAQEIWTLKHCIEYGLKNHRSTIIYANEKMISAARAKEVFADFLPRISLSAALDNNLKVQQSVLPAGVLGPTETTISFTQKYNSDAVAQVDQLVFDQSLLIGLQANKYNDVQADLRIAQNHEQIIYQISIAFFQVLVYREQIEKLVFNKGTYEKQLEIYRLQVSKGIILQKDLDKITVDYNNTVSNIRVAQRNLELTKNTLKFEMGYPLGKKLDITASIEVKLPSVSELGANPFIASSRTSYQIEAVNLKLLALEQSRIKASALPSLSAYFRYGAVGFGDKLKTAYGTLYPYSTIGLKLNIPLLDYPKRNARYRQASLNRVNAEEAIKLSEDKYSVEFESARIRLIQAEANMENDKRNVALAETVLRVTDLQFQKGTTDLTDWLNTQHALKEAQSSYLNALYSYYQARIDLEKAAGSLKIFYESL